MRPNNIFLKAIYFPIAWILLFVFYFPVWAQNFSLVKHVSISKIQKFSLDPAGNLYTFDSIGNLAKYDKDLNLLMRVAPSFPAGVNQVDAWYGLKVFTFIQDASKIVIYDRFLSEIKSFRVPQDLIGFPVIVAPASDDGLWTIDASDISIKKINQEFNNVKVSNPLNQILRSEDAIKFYCLREYQNRVFALNGESLFVFDLFGNLMREVKVDGLKNLFFTGDFLTYINNNGEVELLNLFTAERKVLKINPAYLIDNPPINSSNGVVFYNSKQLLIHTTKGFLLFEQER